MPALDETFSDSPEATGVGHLDLVRVNENPVIAVLFTKDADDLKTHYVAGSVNAEVHCNLQHEPRCLLCDLQDRPTTRHLLPVYLVDSDAVSVLRVSDTRSPYALGPQLAAEIRRGDLDKRFVLISRTSNKYTVVSTLAKEGQDMGERVVRAFLERQKTCGIELKQAIPIYPNAELFDVPELERKALALGLSRSTYMTSTPAEEEPGRAASS